MDQDGAISAASIDFLCSPAGRDALAGLQEHDLEPATAPAVIARLRRTLSPDDAGAVLAMAGLRRKAAAKFPDAERMYFTAQALEQSTGADVAAHRALRIDRLAPPGPVLDLGCGIGGDALALARRRDVVAFERDPTRARIARANADALGLSDRLHVVEADWVEMLNAGSLPSAAAAFVDPSRRRDGRRIYAAAEMAPPPAVLHALRERYPTLCVKARPGLDDSDIPDGAAVEFVGHAGVCKEAVLWMGAFADGPRRWASVHDGAAWHAIAASGASLRAGPLGPGDRLIEPHPAVIRAGAVADLAGRIGAHAVDPRIAYLIVPAATGPVEIEPFGRAFEIIDVMPFSLRALNRRLRTLGIGRVELKKRGAPFEPESMRARLKLVEGGTAAVVFFTRRGDERVTIIARRVGERTEGDGGPEVATSEMRGASRDRPEA